MSERRKIGNSLFFAAAVVMAVLSLVVVISTIRTVRESSQNFNDNLVFYTSQIEYETMQLLDHLDMFWHGRGDIDHDAVMLRYDVLWSRVFTPLDSESLGADPSTAATAQSTMNQVQVALRDIEQGITNLGPMPSDDLLIIQDRLRVLIPIVRDLRLSAKDARANNQASFRQNQIRQIYLVFFLILGMTFFGFLATMLLRSDRYQIATMNTQLESRVRKRTQDLKAANGHLAAEIAERKRSQDMAAEREARLEQAVQLAKLGYYAWCPAGGGCEFTSDQHAAAFAMAPKEFKDMATSRAALLEMIHPDDQAKMRENYDALSKGRIIDVSFRALTRSGERYIREVARPTFDEHGTVIREVGSTIDMTEQHQTELKLFEAQKMDSIGKMTGGVAHDFNNLLAVILGNLELLTETMPEGEHSELVRDAIMATLRGRDLTMNMLSFARRAPMDPTQLDLNLVVRDMQSLLRRTVPENISIQVALPKQTWTVVADRSLTESALLNLAINARDAMPNGGSLTIETANITIDDQRSAKDNSDIAPGDYVMLAVTDTGKGIHPSVLPQIFEPFFSTKSATKNSGLGLSMVQGFIKQTGGEIRVYSEIGVGSTFKMFFAAVDSTATSEALPTENRTAEFDQGQGLRVLLVEDEDTVRRTLMRQLSTSGMLVTEAADSAAAEHAFKTQGPFDLIISDIVMPGDLQGPALLRRLREFDPTLPAILLSGYPQEATVHGNGVLPEDVMLMKPVQYRDLLNAIRQVVDPESAT